ncbi:MAG: ATP-dependent 6-phosphofructokinase [Planctomycetota bacterium]|jgi:6-phosphofructokinase 1
MWSFPPVDEAIDFTPARLGEPSLNTVYKIDKQLYVDDKVEVSYFVRSADLAASREKGRVPMFECAGPREKIFFDPSELVCGIVTCGGLCPGLNDVIRTITLTLQWEYNVRRVLGFRFGYQGLSSNAQEPPLELTPESVDNIQHLGGTMLGSSRGHQEPEDMVAALRRHNVRLLFVIGGDGTFAGAHEIVAECERQGRKIAVVGIPKTIDNDIYFTETTFGYATAVEEARRILGHAHVEAKASWNGVSLVKLMGRDSGFIAAGASIASGDVNFCLIPEVPIVLEGADGFLAKLEKRLDRKHHAVVVVAEGAGQELTADSEPAEKDASGNVVYDNIGTYLKKRIKDYFEQKNKPVTVRYFDPSYEIRSCPANANDSAYCLLLGLNAVHAGMAGKTDMFVGYWNQHYIHVPLAAAINRRKRLDTQGQLWQTILTTLE